MKNFKKYIFGKYYLPIVLLRDIHEENLTLNDADEEESMLVSIKVNINIKWFEWRCKNSWKKIFSKQ